MKLEVELAKIGEDEESQDVHHKEERARRRSWWVCFIVWRAGDSSYPLYLASYPHSSIPFSVPKSAMTRAVHFASISLCLRKESMAWEESLREGEENLELAKTIGDIERRKYRIEDLFEKINSFHKSLVGSKTCNFPIIRNWQKIVKYKKPSDSLHL